MAGRGIESGTGDGGPPVRVAHRRSMLGAASAVVLAGCLGLFEGQLTFEATPPSVSSGVVESSGYDHIETRERVIERSFEADGDSADVRTINWTDEYEKSVDTPFGTVRAAFFVAMATPQVEVLGEIFNPVGDMSAEELAERIQANYAAIDDLERLDQGPVEVLGHETTRHHFVGQGELALGIVLDIDVHLTDAIAHEGDFVIAVGAFPSFFSGELEDVVAMMEAVEHGSD